MSKILSSLNEAQLKAATYDGPSKNVLVVAGAGTGKTRTLIGRLAYLNSREDLAGKYVVALTFTNKAAQEIAKRLSKEYQSTRVKILHGTFHSFFLRIIRKRPALFGMPSYFRIIDSDDQLEIVRTVRGEALKKAPEIIRKTFWTPREILALISLSKNLLLPFEELLERKEIKDELSLYLLKCQKSYEKLKKAQNYLDFDDILLFFLKALEKDARIRKVFKEHVYEIVVDEMQDTNPLQFEILKILSKSGCRLFCVGDPAQSIYGFRGANFENVYNFKTTLKDADVLTLSKNYRSYQEILDVANWLLKRSTYSYDSFLEAVRGSRKKPLFLEFPSPQQEAAWVARDLKEYQKTGQLKDVLILVRSVSSVRLLEAELKRCGIPYNLIGGTSLQKAAHVRDVLSAIGASLNLKDFLCWSRFLQFFRGIGQKTAKKLHDQIQKASPEEAYSLLAASKVPLVACSTFQKVRKTKTPQEAVEAVLEELFQVFEERYQKDWEKRRKDLEILSQIAARFKTHKEFLDSFSLDPVYERDSFPGKPRDTATISTIHAAKGKEASRCYVYSVGPGACPSRFSLGSIEKEEEERRVLYVALTRAKDTLIISWSSSFWHSDFSIEPCTEDFFLESLPADLVEKQSFFGQERKDDFRDFF